MSLIESLLNENRKLSLNKNRKRLKERAAETVFKKGDIVVAKDEFLDKGEEVKDTIGIVLDHKAENDYLQLGVLHPEDYTFPPIFNGRGEYYRLITDDERSKWIDNEVVGESKKKKVKESFDIKRLNNKPLKVDYDEEARDKCFIYNNHKFCLGDLWSAIYDDVPEYIKGITDENPDGSFPL